MLNSVSFCVPSRIPHFNIAIAYILSTSTKSKKCGSRQKPSRKEHVSCYHCTRSNDAFFAIGKDEAVIAEEDENESDVTKDDTEEGDEKLEGTDMNDNKGEKIIGNEDVIESLDNADSDMKDKNSDADGLNVAAENEQHEPNSVMQTSSGGWKKMLKPTAIISLLGKKA